MEGVSLALVAVIVLAVAFDYINGFHDTANAIATSVATRALHPRHAILMSTVFNFVGASSTRARRPRLWWRRHSSVRSPGTS